MRDRNGRWRREWRMEDGGKLQLVDAPRAKPYLRIEDRNGLYVDSIDGGDRRLRAIANALYNAADRARPKARR